MCPVSASLQQSEESTRLLKSRIQRLQEQSGTSSSKRGGGGGGGGSSGDASLIKSLQLLVNCKVCETHQKDRVITKCMHTLCQSCVKQNLEVSATTPHRTRTASLPSSCRPQRRLLARPVFGSALTLFSDRSLRTPSPPLVRLGIASARRAASSSERTTCDPCTSEHRQTNQPTRAAPSRSLQLFDHWLCASIVRQSTPSLVWCLSKNGYNKEQAWNVREAATKERHSAAVESSRRNPREKKAVASAAKSQPNKICLLIKGNACSRLKPLAMPANAEMSKHTVSTATAQVCSHGLWPVAHQLSACACLLDDSAGSGSAGFASDSTLLK